MSTAPNPKRYLVTSALPYANGPLHIGHIAGAYLPADIFVRFMRMKGQDVVWVCGSDEHGAAITLRAKKDGIPPQAVIDKYHEINKKAFAQFGISFDIYHRTSDPLHHETAQGFFTKLLEKGQFLVEESEQYYDAEAEQFLADRYIQGSCPKCGQIDAFGDQCEKCGSSLSATDLINPRSVLSGSKPEMRKTSHWFLPLNEHEDWVREWIVNGKLDGKAHHDPKAWKNHVLGQCKSWLDGGLQPRAMTRDLDWGVKVPVEGADGKVLYVWLDAPIGYVSATKAWAKEHGKDWKTYWQDPDTELVHFIGKDNIVFHCIIFPIILKAHGDYILPTNVPANEFLNLEGNKISTSRNWAVWLHEYIEDFPDGKDVLRYVLNSIAPENKDAEFTWKDFQKRNNNELVAVLGNFVNRTMVLTHKYFNGDVPVAHELLPVDQALVDEMALIPDKIDALIRQYKFKEAQFEAMNLARLGNKYLADMQPWKLATEELQITGTILNLALQVCANLSLALRPFLPETAEKIRFMLGSPKLAWSQAGRADLMIPYNKLGKPELLFGKIEDKTVEEQVLKLEKTKLANTPAEPVKEETDFGTFAQMDLRIGRIVHAEKVPKTKKLLKLTIADGHANRTIVSGIAAYYEPEDIIDRQVVFLANLAPKELKGIMSQGMILMAEDRDGSLSFVTPDKKLLEGSIVR